MTKLFFVATLAGGVCILGAQVQPNAADRVDARQALRQQVGEIVRTEIMVAGAVTGKPFSATQEQHSLQVLGDGTRIERTESSAISRDSAGRTRTEAAHAPGEAATFATIQDPAEGRNVVLNIAQKTAQVGMLPKLSNAKTAVRVQNPTATQPASSVTVTHGADGERIGTGIGIGVGGGGGSSNIVISQVATKGVKPMTDDLGALNINGVLAKGTRTTTTIPAGQIGNDRPIQVVSERWYSDELQMVVKSSNSDPRFGTTEFNLTGINRAEPDPSQFQIPADYTVKSGK